MIYILKSNTEFINELEQKHPYVEALEKYVNNDTKIKFRCKIDGNEWYSTPRTILRTKVPCKICRDKNRRTTESFKMELKEINDEIKNVFCHSNGIDLLRIPYYEYNNIEKILDDKLS